MGIAISRRESAANLGARLRYSDRPVYALRQTRARAAQAPDFGALEAAAVQGGPEEAVTLGVLRNKFVGCEAEATWDALRDAAHRSELAHVDETGKVQASCAGHGQ